MTGPISSTSAKDSSDCFTDRVEAAEAVGEDLGVARADVPDVEPRKQPPERPRLGGVDPRQEVIDGFLTHALEFHQDRRGDP